MNNLITIIKFTIKDMITRKSFIISTIIILLMIVVGTNVPNIMKGFSSSSEKEKIVIIDENNIYENRLNELNNLDINYDLDVNNLKIDEVKEKVEKEEYSFGIIIEKIDDTNIKLTLVVKNVLMSSGMPEDLKYLITTLYKNIKLEKLNITTEQINSINPLFTYDMVQSSDEAKGNVLAMMLMSIVLFYAIFFCAYQVSSSITVEKTSKIMETLVTSTTPKNIVLGKTIGVGLVGLCQLSAMLIVALICSKLFMPKEIIDIILDTSTITIPLILITLFYFILGYTLFSLLFALTGSTVSKPEDIQSANGPITIIAVVGFYIAYFSMMNPNSGLNNFATLFPISSPFCMPFRIMMELASPIDIISSILILIVTIIVIAKISIKIYSNAILNYGTKLSIKDLIRMYKQK